jgi:hypothetical protein
VSQHNKSLFPLIRTTDPALTVESNTLIKAIRSGGRSYRRGFCRDSIGNAEQQPAVCGDEVVAAAGLGRTDPLLGPCLNPFSVLLGWARYLRGHSDEKIFA